MPNTPRHKKERKVSIVFRRTDEPVHCGGVESLDLLPDGSLLTASRDATIRRWNVQGPQPICQTTYVGHADWVNDLATLDELLFSCSNDKTVRVWQPSGSQAAVLNHHSDYVTCLAAAKPRNLVASGGLRGELFLIDPHSGQTHRLRPKVQPAPSQSSAYSSPGRSHFGMASESQSGAGNQKVPAGIYSLAMDGSGAVLAAGSSDALIRLWDTRSGEKVCKLRGHTENVRVLRIKDDCSLMLSGSADGTFRLWDLTMQRCVQTYVVHTDSVWSLEPSSDWSVVYSGGRDRNIQRTHLNSRATELLVQESQAVSAIAVNQQDNTLWAATARSSVNQWPLPREPMSPHITTHASARRRGVGGVGGVSHNRQSIAQPLCTQPVRTIQGIPAIVAHKVLSDRRRVLTKDDQGVVSLWDVLQGAEIERYGQADMDTVERELFDARHCPAWFTADNRLGLLSISLDPPQCFNAEEYQTSCGYPNAPEDAKYNYGKIVLDCVFAKWKYKAQHPLATQASSTSQLSQSAAQTAMSVDRNGSVGPNQRQPYVEQWARTGQHAQHAQQGQGQPAQHAQQNAGNMTLSPQQSQSGISQQDESQTTYFPEHIPGYWQGVHPAVTCQSASGAPWYRVISRFTGTEQEPEDIPSWIGDIVLRNAAPLAKELKCAFVLLPAEGSNLPSLLQSRLNAPRILQVHKVVTYCISRLAETEPIQLASYPVYLKPPANGRAHEYRSQEPNGPCFYLELLCNGYAVPYDMSLSSVKKFIWCKPDEIVFHYRLLDPHNPAPLPKIQPPTST